MTGVCNNFQSYTPNFLNPRIFSKFSIFFSSSRFSPPSSTLLFNVTIRAFSRTRVKRRNRGGRSAIRIGIEKTGGNEGIGSKVEIALDASARGWFYTACDRRRLSTRRERLSDGVSTPFLSFPSRFPLAPRPLLLLISSDPTLYLGLPFLLFISWLPLLFRSGSSVSRKTEFAFFF